MSSDQVKGLGPQKNKYEQAVAIIISACFMALVGLSMPPLLDLSINENQLNIIENSQLDWKFITTHTMMITLLSNLGKMFPIFCYKREVSIRERIALSIGMCPRGEVGAGIIIIALSLGLKGPMMLIAILALSLNLALTGFFILIIKTLLNNKKHN